MIETDTTDAGTLAQRLHIAASPDWQNLLTYFDLSGEGFAFIVLIVPDKDWADACRYALERYLLSFRRKLVVVSFDSAEEFKDKLAERLLSLQPDEETGAVWVSAAVPEAVKEYESWAEAWRTGAARLNQYRNPLREQFNVPLLFVGASWIQPVLREMAPDLWSVRTLVVRIEPPVSQTESNQDGSSESFTTKWDEGWAIDPDFALREAEKLRGQSGKELSLASLLHRAAKGFIVRYRMDEASQALAEAVALRRRFGADTEDMAESMSDLADVLIWKNDYEQAEIPLLEALRLFQQIGDILGEANCILSLGDIAFQQSKLETAQARYEQALSLYRQIGDVVGEANSIKSLGNIALEHQQLDEAQARYEQALLLYQQISDVLGEANCIRSLGDISLTRSQLNEAQARYEQALSLYRQIGNVRGEGNCILRLGDIALEQKDQATAKQFYVEALELYERIQEPYSIGWAHRKLARLSTDGAERQQHLHAARAAWESIGRTDLIEYMDKEFDAQQ